MTLEEILLQNEKAVLKRWFDLILETYPADVAALMKRDQNQFTNPVGSTISREIEGLFKGLLDERNSERFSASLNSILKIRSVQDFSPSKAVGFIFLLKKAMEETLKGQIGKEPMENDWSKFLSKIDELALHAFDIYMDCREKVCEIRINQAKSEREMAFRMMERMSYSKAKREKEEDPDS
jgi:hypothetical protein